MIRKIPTNKREREIWLRAFRIWQQTPHKVAPMTDKSHVCQSCNTEYLGNFCPRCGQSERVGRFSFKTAFMLFLDVWGIGNRGMFHSIRDLMLRPGYMIRDYVGGMQSAYFPPFKMFFILTAFFLVVSHGINLDIEEQEQNTNIVQKEEQEGFTIDGEKINNKTVQFVKKIPKYLQKFEDAYPSIFTFLVLLLISAPLYLFLRRSPSVPDLRYTEHLVALIYTANMHTLYLILAQLLHGGITHIIKLIALFMIFVALKQFTGYSKRRLFGYFLLTISFLAFLFIAFLILICTIIYLTKDAAQ